MSHLSPFPQLFNYSIIQFFQFSYLLSYPFHPFFNPTLFYDFFPVDGTVVLWELSLAPRDLRLMLGSSQKDTARAVEVGPQVVLKGHTDRVTDMIYQPSGVIETVSLDGTMRVWVRIAPVGDVIVSSNDNIAQSLQSTSMKSRDRRYGSTSTKNGNSGNSGNSGDIRDSLHALQISSDSLEYPNNSANGMNNSSNSNDHRVNDISVTAPQSVVKYSFSENNGFICRVVLKIFGTELADQGQGGIVLFSTSDYSPTAQSLATNSMSTADTSIKNVRRDSKERGIYSRFSFSDYQPKVRSSVVFKSEVTEALEGGRDSADRGTGGGGGGGGDRGPYDEGDDEEKSISRDGRDSAVSVSTAPKRRVKKSWLVAVSLEGTIKVFSTPSFTVSPPTDTRAF